MTLDPCGQRREDRAVSGRANQNRITVRSLMESQLINILSGHYDEILLWFFA
jgi:hypothetical protein